MLTARDIMTADPVCCTPETSLQDVAQMMIDTDCGALPVTDSEESRTPIGVITDRDIVARAVSQGKDLRVMTASDCMSTPCVTVDVDSSMDECVETLEGSLIRRVPVIDEDGECCGIIAQADIARFAKGEAGEMVQRSSGGAAADAR
jgi:CBS domain-containing protein